MPDVDGSAAPGDNERIERPDIMAALTVLLAAGLTMRDIEARLIRRAVASHGGDKRAAARHLGLSLSTIYGRLPASAKPGRWPEHRPVGRRRPSFQESE